jgi:GNAT superfamily N-acetyltransferase
MTSIAKITDLELAALDELRVESLREGYRFIERLCREWASGANRFNAPGEALFLAFADGRVAGVCGLNRDPYAHDPRIGRVRRLYVTPSHRRSGLGRALLGAVVAQAHPHFSLLLVRTDAAGEFYTSRGFRRSDSYAETTHVLELTHPDFSEWWVGRDSNPRPMP